MIEKEVEEASNSEPEVLNKNVVETYQLYHYRFAHLRPAKIGAIHKMSTHSKPIKVAKCECEVCQETKMVKRKGRVTERKGHLSEYPSIPVGRSQPQERDILKL